MTKVRFTLPIFVCIAVAIVPSAFAAGTPTTAVIPAKYQIEQHWKLGGNDGWDLLAIDEKARRLYISRSDHVDVVNMDTGKPVGVIPHTNGVHGIALAPKLGRGFTSNGRANTVTVFDLKTLKTLSEFKIAGKNPDAILYDAASSRVFTFNGGSHTATAINATSGDVVATIDLIGKPEFAVSDGKGRVFVNIENRNEIVVIDTKRMKKDDTWSLAPCAEPTGLAMDSVHQRLFSVCQDQMMVVLDSDSGKRVASVPIGKRPDAAAFDAQRGLVFSSNGDGTLTVIHEDDPQHFSVVENVPTQKSARTMALDVSTHKIFLAAAEVRKEAVTDVKQPRPRPRMTPDSFTILVVAPSTSH